MKKLIALIAGLVLAMGITASTALAEEEEPLPEPAPAYCVAGQDVTSTQSAKVYFQGGSVTIGLYFADAINDSFVGGKFFAGFLKGTNSKIILDGERNPNVDLEPGWSGPWFSKEGACTKAVVHPPSIAVCSPTVVDRPGDIPGTFLVLDYWTWKNGKDPRSKYPVANFVDGKGLTCDPAPAGYKQAGTAGNAQHVSSEPGYPLWVKG